MERNTIFALATASGKSGLAVMRVSGPAVPVLCAQMCGRVPEARKPSLRTLRDPDTGNILDKCLILRFATGSSFTGEEVVEFHLHGSRSVVRAVETVLSRQPSLRQAEPGEFTRRALENGKLDLTQVEGLSDLIEAESEAQRLQALRVMDGDLSQKVASWRERLIRALAFLEATIDFSDEELPEEVSAEILSLTGALREEFLSELAGSRSASLIRDGFEVAIVGSPNVGKSTLLNKIAGREVAITSEQPGTTRDILEVHLELAGQKVILLDTAGQRDGRDEVEKVGIARGRARAIEADLRIFLCENGVREDFGVPAVEGDIVVTAKADLRDVSSGMTVSGLTGQGVGTLLDYIGNELSSRVSHRSSLIRERHITALSEAVEYLGGVESLLVEGPGKEDLAAEELRLSVGVLDKLVGRVDVEGLLDVIFSSFCIGK